jgi:hypothetical protein
VGLISAPYQPGDEVGINALYERLTGRRRERRHFAWEWLQQPTGEPLIWVIREEESGEIVGQHCLMPLELSWFGRRVLIGKTENTMMHPRYRGTGAYFPFEQRFVEHELDDRFSMLMTTWAGGAPGKIRAKLGYRELGRWAEYLHFADRTRAAGFLDAAARKALESRPRAQAVARRSLALLAPVAVRHASRRRRLDGHDLTLSVTGDLEPVADEIDAFWEGNRACYGITIWRSSRYLRWRLFDNPWVDHELWIARRGPDLVGYAVVLRGEDGSARLIDTLVEGNDEELLAAMFAAVTRALVERGVELVRAGVLGPSRCQQRALTRAGFLRLELPSIERSPRPRIRRRSGAPVMVRVLDPTLEQAASMDPRNWYFSVLFTEGIS